MNKQLLGWFTEEHSPAPPSPPNEVNNQIRKSRHKEPINCFSIFIVATCQRKNFFKVRENSGNFN